MNTVWEKNKFKSFNKFLKNMKPIFSSLEISNNIVSQALEKRFVYSDISNIMPDNIQNMNINNIDEYVGMTEPFEKFKSNIKYTIDDEYENKFIIISDLDNKTNVKLFYPDSASLIHKYRDLSKSIETLQQKKVAHMTLEKQQFDLLKSAKRSDLKLFLKYDCLSDQFLFYCQSPGRMTEMELSRADSEIECCFDRDLFAYLEYDALQSFTAITVLNYIDLYTYKSKDDKNIIMMQSNWTCDGVVDIDLYEKMWFMELHDTMKLVQQ